MINAQQPVALGECLANDDDLLSKVLRAYKLNCKYLKRAEVIPEGDPAEGGRVIGRCEFAIPESCYIDDTGHFNSVEFNICYNQMMYYVIAKSIKEDLMSSFRLWTMDDYWNKQLPDIYIVKFESSFRRSMRARRFFGEIEFVNIRRQKDLLYINTLCRYWDERDGNCSGSIKLVIVDPRN
jgi:hypothetical protein